MKKLLPIIILFCSVTAFSQVNKDIKQFYWSSKKEKCEKCDSITYDGNQFLIFNAPTLHLTVTVTDVEKLLQVSVLLENKSSSQRIEFDPNRAILALYGKQTDTQPVEYHPVTPEQAAKKLAGNQNLKNFFNLLLAGMATQQTTVNSQTQGNMTVRGSGGTANATYEEQTKSTIVTPNRAVQEQAERAVAERNANSKSLSDSILAWSLRANTVFPEKELMGNIYFERKKGYTMYIAILINDELYVFPFRAPQ